MILRHTVTIYFKKYAQKRKHKILIIFASGRNLVIYNRKIKWSDLLSLNLKKKWPSGKILCRACDQLTLVFAISITNIYIDKILRTRKKAAKSDNWFLIMWNVIRNWILFNKISFLICVEKQLLLRNHHCL